MLKFDGIKWRNLTQKERNNKNKYKWLKRKRKYIKDLDSVVNTKLLNWISS